VYDGLIHEPDDNLTQEAIELYIESFGIEDLPMHTSKPLWTTVEVAYT